MTDAKVPVLPEGVERALQEGVMNINTLYRNKAINAEEAASLRGDWRRARHAFAAALKRERATGVEEGSASRAAGNKAGTDSWAAQLRAEADALEGENGL